MNIESEVTRTFNSDENIVLYTFISFISIGLILKMLYNPVISNNSKTYGNATMNIISNTIIVFISIFYLMYNRNSSIFNIIILFNILIIFEMFILNNYYIQINTNVVPRQYKLWSFFSSIVIIIYSLIFIVLSTNNHLNNHIISIILYSSAFILFSSLVIQSIILDYLMVDL